jgi:hypothetical protein
VFINRQDEDGKTAPETSCLNPLNAELNPICHLLELLGAHHILHVSGVRVKICTAYKEHSSAIKNS